MKKTILIVQELKDSYQVKKNNIIEEIRKIFKSIKSNLNEYREENEGEIEDEAKR